MILGITGTLGAGKGTVVEYLVAHKGFTHFAVSDTFLAGEAIKRNLVPDRITRRDIANEFRAKGPTALMEEVYKLAHDAIEMGKDVIIEPQHTVAEVTFIQEKGGTVLAVDADVRVRYERIAKRGSEKDKVTFEQFDAEQKHEMASNDPNKNNLGDAVASADYTISNDGTLEALHAQIEEILGKINH